ncbi:hypothetical protein BH10CHL1_BH10CHL1_14770 [soil metagenome]
MLNYEQLRHFAEHGWVLEENVLNQAQIEAYKAAMERHAQYVRPVAHTDNDEILNLDCMVNSDPIFREWIMIPHVLEANRQLMGAEIKYETCHAMIKRPHPDRQRRYSELRNPDTMGWHRGLRPKWGTYVDDADPDLINCTFLNNITYLTDVTPGDGGTMVLDGSHKLEGKYATLKDRCPVVELTAPAGSILHFTETLLHSGVPILSEHVRYTMFYGFTPNWYVNWPGTEVPPYVLQSVRDDELRGILGKNAGYSGQYPVIST